ncbi:transmembrane protein 132D [Tachysurus vachellii]|uniref:transmembrane protein 132D n=1 Tax=Tachysurus vachellii TaxID=175792 RepID=UPI00296AFAB1|nr:transmembrane protein 132D [Tachysurus vachellii]
MEKMLIRMCTASLILPLLCRVMDGRLLLEGLPRFGAVPTYLPVQYQVLNAELAFFLKEANQDIMRNSSLQARTELFFIQQARRIPVVNASYGPFSVQQPIPMELLDPGIFNNPLTSSLSTSSSSSSPLFTFNWKIQTYIISERIHLSWPKVQVLFYIVGRDWDDYSTMDHLPCIRMFAFHETQEVRGTCRLKGELGLCVAELEPLPSWFSPPSVVPGRQRAPQTEGTPVELYYMVQYTETGECNPESSRKMAAIRSEPQGPAGYFSGPTPMRRIGSVRLFQPLSELRLDRNFVVMVPSRPIRQRETVSVFLAASALSSVEIFTLRVKLKDDVAFLGAKVTNPVQWTVSQDVRNEGHRVVTLHCRRKDTSYSQRMESGIQKVLQVDLEVNGLVDPLGTRSVTWQVEYPMSRTFSEEIPSLIRLAAHDLGGIVPLAMETEILNTAVLTGRTVAMPIKVVTVATDGAVTDVTESVECRSTDDDVVKVSERCDYVYVNGKETRGRVRMMLNFTYSYLSTQLEVSVWMPRLPLQIDIADPELNQIKGWRIPVSGGNQRSTDDDEVDVNRPDRRCGPQYQSTTVRVLTHFEAEPVEGRDQPDFLLGSDWQVDVSELVKDLLKVEDSRVARITDGTTLTGLNTGTTKVQVMSPLSDSVLAERSVRIVDDKVSITDLGVQLVSGLSLSLQLSPGSNRAIAATATTQDTMHRTKQESLVSAWLHFSDGSVTPLDLYDPAHYVLTATSSDERVVTVQSAVWWRSPVVVVKGEGQGTLLRVEMSGADLCQKSKRRNVLSSVSTNVRIKFSHNDDNDNRRHRPSSPYNGDSISEAGMVNRGTTTIKTGAPLGDKRPVGDIPADFSNFPAQAEPPHGHTTEEELLQARRGLTDLEIGMYALLGVFCLAILVFLINCVSYALQYQNKQLPLEAQESMAHAHDWVWLGQEGELMENHAGLCLQQDELSATVDSSLGLEEASQLLNGLLGQKSAQGQGGREHKGETGNSPTTKRKRVKFTTFSHSKTGSDCLANSPLGMGKNDIQWVCPDIKLGDSIELRNYMERLNENATKNTA